MLRDQMYTIQCLILSTLLAIIGYLQRANKTIQKFLADTHERMEVRMLIYQIKQQGCIDYDRFNTVYTGFVERKRQSLLKEINRIDNQFMTDLRRRIEAGLPNKGMPAETQKKKAVLETFYAYLKTDDAYQQKAFKLFLNKKIEEMVKKGNYYSKIEVYLENKRRASGYEEYIESVSRPVNIHLPRLWADFFRSGAGYMDVLPKKWPHVAYSKTDTDIPRFIFEKPYAHQYSEQEFCAMFIKEWDSTHYNPHYDYDCNDPAYYADYDGELADRPQNAYHYYLCAVSRFKQIQQRLKVNTEADKGDEL